MSTRIYQGFRLKTDSFTEALAIIEGFRPWVVAQAEAQMDAFIGRISASGRTPVEAYRLWQDRRLHVEKTKESDPGVDTDFSLSLVPSGGHLLGIVYTASNAWFQAWINHPGVEEYGYWDSSDGLEDVSEEDWEDRRKAWEVLTHAPVSVQSFAIELVLPRGPLPKSLR